MRIHTIADTHFKHDAMWERFKIRPKDFEEKIIDSWKREVKEDDLIIHVGDVLFSHLDDWNSIISMLPGRKILCKGNHDKKPIRWYMMHGFDFCCQEFLIKMFGLRILFSHEPKYTENYFDLNIHGHLHEKSHREYKCDKRHHLISLENQGYTPRLLSTVVKEWQNSRGKK